MRGVNLIKPPLVLTASPPENEDNAFGSITQRNDDGRWRHFSLRIADVTALLQAGDNAPCGNVWACAAIGLFSPTRAAMAGIGLTDNFSGTERRRRNHCIAGVAHMEIALFCRVLVAGDAA